VDLSNPEELERIPGRFDAVVHLAALLPSPSRSPAMRDWFQHNAGATLALLQFCVNRGIKRFVLGSTWSVYGDPTGRSCVSEAAEPAPADGYSLSKLAAETLALPFAFVHGLSVVILRFGFIVGKGMRADTVVCRFLAAARDGQPLRVLNGGTDVTDIVAASDAAAATEIALARGEGVFNIGGGVPVLIRDLAQACGAEIGKKVDLAIEPAQRAPRTMWMAIEKARNELGWQPAAGLATALRAVDA
jgi:UDP-glucuronate 4-epimerase